MRKLLKSLRVTLAAGVLALGLALTASLTNIDLVKLDLEFLNGIQKHEVDDLLTGLLLIFVGLVVDRVVSERRKRRLAENEEQKLRTLRATMRTVQDIVNNFLNNLLLFEMEVEDLVPPHTIDRLEARTQEVFQMLKALGDVDVVREKPLAMGAGIEYRAIPAAAD